MAGQPLGLNIGGGVKGFGNKLRQMAKGFNYNPGRMGMMYARPHSDPRTGKSLDEWGSWNMPGSAMPNRGRILAGGKKPGQWMLQTGITSGPMQKQYMTSLAVDFWYAEWMRKNFGPAMAQHWEHKLASSGEVGVMGGMLQNIKGETFGAAFDRAREAGLGGDAFDMENIARLFTKNPHMGAIEAMGSKMKKGEAYTDPVTGEVIDTTSGSVIDLGFKSYGYRKRPGTFRSVDPRMAKRMGENVQPIPVFSGELGSRQGTAGGYNVRTKRGDDDPREKAHQRIIARMNRGGGASMSNKEKIKLVDRERRRAWLINNKEKLYGLDFKSKNFEEFKTAYEKNVTREHNVIKKRLKSMADIVGAADPDLQAQVVNADNASKRLKAFEEWSELSPQERHFRQALGMSPEVDAKGKETGKIKGLGGTRVQQVAQMKKNYDRAMQTLWELNQSMTAPGGLADQSIEKATAAGWDYQGIPKHGFLPGLNQLSRRFENKFQLEPSPGEDKKWGTPDDEGAFSLKNIFVRDDALHQIMIAQSIAATPKMESGGYYGFGTDAKADKVKELMMARATNMKRLDPKSGELEKDQGFNNYLAKLGEFFEGRGGVGGAEAMGFTQMESLTPAGLRSPVASRSMSADEIEQYALQSAMSLFGDEIKSPWNRHTRNLRAYGQGAGMSDAERKFRGLEKGEWKEFKSGAHTWKLAKYPPTWERMRYKDQKAWINNPANWRMDLEKKRRGGFINKQRGGPLGEAIQRESKVRPLSSIRVTQDSKLRTGGNPAGLGVTNIFDEPNGEVPFHRFDSINAAQNSGRQRGGFVPNFAGFGPDWGGLVEWQQENAEVAQNMPLNPAGSGAKQWKASPADKKKAYQEIAKRQSKGGNRRRGWQNEIAPGIMAATDWSPSVKAGWGQPQAGFRGFSSDDQLAMALQSPTSLIPGALDMQIEKMGLKPGGRGDPIGQMMRAHHRRAQKAQRASWTPRGYGQLQVGGTKGNRQYTSTRGGMMRREDLAFTSKTMGQMQEQLYAPRGALMGPGGFMGINRIRGRRRGPQFTGGVQRGGFIPNFQDPGPLVHYAGGKWYWGQGPGAVGINTPEAVKAGVNQSRVHHHNAQSRRMTSMQKSKRPTVKSPVNKAGSFLSRVLKFASRAKPGVTIPGPNEFPLDRKAIMPEHRLQGPERFVGKTPQEAYGGIMEAYKRATNSANSQRRGGFIPNFAAPRPFVLPGTAGGVAPGITEDRKKRMQEFLDNQRRADELRRSKKTDEPTLNALAQAQHQQIVQRMLAQQQRGEMNIQGRDFDLRAGIGGDFFPARLQGEGTIGLNQPGNPRFGAEWFSSQRMMAPGMVQSMQNMANFGADYATPDGREMAMDNIFANAPRTYDATTGEQGLSAGQSFMIPGMAMPTAMPGAIGSLFNANMQGMAGMQAMGMGNFGMGQYLPQMVGEGWNPWAARRGGFIPNFANLELNKSGFVQGVGAGDTKKGFLPAGSLVVNRRAAALTAQRGGHVPNFAKMMPVAVESGERVIPPGHPNIKQYSKLNSQVGRFSSNKSTQYAREGGMIGNGYVPNFQAGGNVDGGQGNAEMQKTMTDLSAAVVSMQEGFTEALTNNAGALETQVGLISNWNPEIGEVKVAMDPVQIKVETDDGLKDQMAQTAWNQNHPNTPPPPRGV